MSQHGGLRETCCAACELQIAHVVGENSGLDLAELIWVVLARLRHEAVVCLVLPSVPPQDDNLGTRVLLRKRREQIRVVHAADLAGCKENFTICLM